MRSFSRSMSPSSSRPENQPPQTEIAVAGEDRAELVHVHREAAAGLHAGEACDARLSQALLEADVVGEFGEIVVPPGDGGDSEFGFHARHTPTRCLARICSCSLRAFCTDSRVRDLRHADVPVGVAGDPGPGVGGDRQDGRPVVALGPFERRFEVGEALAMPRGRAHGLGVLGEIDVKRRLAVHHPAIDEQVVEAGHALGLLQAVDHGVPAVVADHDDHLVAAENRRIDVRIHHHVGAVADHDDRRAAEAAGSGVGHRMAPAGGDLVAHAGEAELDVEGVRGLDAPALGDLARKAAGRRDHGVLFARRVVHGAGRLGRRSGRARCSAHDARRARRPIP